MSIILNMYFKVHVCMCMLVRCVIGNVSQCTRRPNMCTRSRKTYTNRAFRAVEERVVSCVPQEVVNNSAFSVRNDRCIQKWPQNTGRC